jgi:HK97 family phage prohead protease
MRHVNFSATITKDEKIDGEYRAYASTSDIDRDGEIVLPHSFTNLEQWVKNQGPIYYGHAWRSYGTSTEENLPIGKATGAWIEPDRMGIKFVFADGGPMLFAKKVRWLVDNGYLNKMSIGAIPLKWEQDSEGHTVYTEMELLEVSVVGIPSNRSADILREMKAAGYEIKDDESKRLFVAGEDGRKPPKGVKAPEVDPVAAGRKQGLDVVRIYEVMK